MIRKRVPIPGTVTYNYRDFFGGPVGGVVGQPPWNDDSDASYVDLYGSCHPDAAFMDSADGFVAATDLSHLPSDRTKVKVFARLRCRALTSTGVEAPMDVSLWYSPSNMITQERSAAAPTGTMEWIDIGPMPFATQADYDRFVAYTESGGLRVRVNMVATRPASGGWRYPGVRVTEVHLTVQSPGGKAFPCQNFPRDDSGDAFPCQNYPPPKSHQGGQVNFGYW